MSFEKFNAKIIKDMDKFIIKKLIILSLILGAILGLLEAVPFLGVLILLIALLFVILK